MGVGGVVYGDGCPGKMESPTRWQSWGCGFYLHFRIAIKGKIRLSPSAGNTDSCLMFCFRSPTPPPLTLPLWPDSSWTSDEPIHSPSELNGELPPTAD